MAVMRALIPAVETALPGDGWSLVATQAGRYENGLRASIQVYHHEDRKKPFQLVDDHRKTWTPCIEFLEQEGACDTSAAEAAINRLFQAIEGMLLPKPRQPRPGRDTPESDRPEIQVNGRQDREILAETAEVLVKINEPPTLFMRGSEWVSVAPGALHAAPFTVPRLRVLVGEVADCVAITMADGVEHKRPARLPFTVCQDFLAKSHEGTFPPLVAIRPAPAFLPDGRLLTTEGYDTESGLLLRLGELRDIRDDMPRDEALRWLFDDLLGDFPFADEPSKAQALAFLLEAFARPLIRDKTPLYLVDGSTRGAGKGLLADAVCMVATGRKAQVMALTGEDAELEKRITALLMSGDSWILMDNATSLKSAALSAALTANPWRGRVLGVSKMVDVPNDATWVCTGNNVELSSEIARRVIPIRLEPVEERPEERSEFKHTPLLAWAHQHRSELVSACLSLVRAWIAAGKPKGKTTLGSFEAWAEVLGGILTHAEVKGFLEGREHLHVESVSETAEWRALYDRWWKTHGGNAITAKDVLALAKANDLLMSLWAGRKEIAGMQRIGHALRGMRGRVFANRRISPAGRDSATKNASFCLVPVKVQGQQETPETLQDAIIIEQSSIHHLSKTPPKTPPESGALGGVFGAVSNGSFPEKSMNLSVSGVSSRPLPLSTNHQKGAGPCDACGGHNLEAQPSRSVACLDCLMKGA